jgi:phosphatidylserine/phosphatidylglycerophosphate/cardiolipin synthase-like enzyme
MKTKYYYFVLLFIFSACSSAPTYGPSGSSNGSDDEDSSLVSSGKPINISFPEAVFTDLEKIKKHKRSKIIIQRIVDLIDATPKDGAIYVSIFLFKNEPGLLSAFRRADIRNVKLHIIFDMSSANARNHNTSTISKLKAIDKNIDIIETYNDASSGAINHNKFVLFSKVKTKTGIVKNAVFTTSENWLPSSEKRIQNAVILSNKGLYKAYLGYWKEMKKRAAQGMKDYTFRKYSAPDDGIWGYLLPKRKGGNPYGPDPIIKILNGITDPSSTTIQIVMPLWTKYRISTDITYSGISIVGKLEKLLTQGAKVEIVVISAIDAHDAVASLANQGAFVKMYNYAGNPDVKKIELHSKVMLIQGEWHGKKTNLVITGSQNFGGGSIRASNNNTLLLSSYHFKHPQFFQRFEDHFNKIKVLPGICCITKD